MNILETLAGSKDIRVLIQGIGTQGKQNAIICRESIVAGISPNPDKQGTFFQNIPIYNTVSQAIEETGVNATVIFVPAMQGQELHFETFSKTISKPMPIIKYTLTAAAEAIYEAIYNEIPLITCITDGIPQRDMRWIKAYLWEVNSNLRLQNKEISLVGPNTFGAVFPWERVKMGIMPSNVVASGNVGIVSRSGSLTYEVMKQLLINKLGQSAIIGIGGDSNRGLDFVDCLELFEKDNRTKVVCLIGEIGGDEEGKAAKAIEDGIITKPVIAYVVGRTAPEGKTMGHAGAINEEEGGSAQEKLETLESAGALVVKTVQEIPKLVKCQLQ